MSAPTQSGPGAVRIDDVVIVPMDGPPGQPEGDVRRGSLHIEGGRLLAVGRSPEGGGAPEVIDGAGLYALPGFVQGHVHYCQTLFRGLADDRPLMRWLKDRIWPLEAAHDGASVTVSAELSIAELLLGGTTTVQVMESVRHAERSFAVAAQSGMTTILGNCLVDDPSGGMPDGLATTTAEAMALSEALHRQFHRATPELHYAVSPRFLLCCTQDLAERATGFARQHDLRIHTHANEHPEEIALVKQQYGEDYLLALESQGWLGSRTTLAHCVHTTDAEREALVRHDVGVVHCPSANLKLGSGLAPIAAYRDRGLRIALGADGAACNNRLCALTEMRQAALLQTVVAGPGVWPAAAALRAATLGGAEALGLEAELGSLTAGKRADLVLIDLDAAPLRPGGDPIARIVYGATAAQIRHVMVGGRWRVRDGQLCEVDHRDVVDRAERELAALLSRAGLSR